MTYEDAIILAVKVHAGQTRWNGEPYVLHPLRVANSLNSHGDTMLKIAAVLHDTIEDGDPRVIPEVDKFGPRTAGTVRALTRDKAGGQTYIDYINSIIASGDWDAMLIKLADLEDNLSDLPRGHGLRKRYERAKAALTKELEGWG